MSSTAAQDLSGLLRQLASAHGDRVAVRDEHRSLTFAKLDRWADTWATAWDRAGYGRGQRIALLAPNSSAWLAAAFGVWRAGATLVPVSTFVTARELDEILAHSEVDALILQSRFRNHSLLETFEATTLARQLQTVVVLDGEAGDARLSANEFLRADEPTAAGRIAPESPACILYTSGTTGRPKGVVLSHRSLLATVQPTARRSGLTSVDSLLSSLPLFWVAGLVIRALPTLAAGCELILMESFTPEAAIAALEQHRPTALHLRPPQVGQLLAHPGYRSELLATVRKGNGRVEWFDGQLAPDASFITGYGMTEMSGYVTALDWRDPPEVRREQIGTPLPGVELVVVDDNGMRCAAGTIGEVWVRGPGLFSGYYRESPALGRSMDGYFRTGDLGCIDDAGSFHFVGRSKDLLRVKGINVSPLEVEAVLAGHPDIEAAYVVGLPADGFDQTLVALVIARNPLDEPALRQHAAQLLSHYKRPEAYVWLRREEVPLGQTSKPQRAQLAAIAAERLGRNA